MIRRVNSGNVERRLPFVASMRSLPMRALQASGGLQHLLDLVDEIAQVEGLRQHLGVLGRLGIGIERDRGKAGDEHHLEVGIDLGGAAGKLDAVHLGHDDVGQKQRERFLAQPLIGAGAIVEIAYLVAGAFQRLDEEAAHIVIVFRQQNACHHIPSESPAPSLPPGKAVNHPVYEVEPVNIK
ncbi:hypothetical protein MPLDJ20_60520 [Mesorhizobium plurifarium]|uniref:Uncharacterized protein n=1 Tax=Mesorhizobium plurifarium TaxID=69974 RepID=A0A090GQH1_MESPL|nr:hypothetical protein MPLDJ20_60520 [Mesorhizobium plurifarium]